MSSFDGGWLYGEPSKSTRFGGGSGSAEDPFILSMPQHIERLSEEVREGGSFKDEHFMLRADIDMGGARLMPIGGIIGGMQRIEFCGSVAGMGHAIHNFTIDAPLDEGAGFFGATYGGRISGLRLGNFRISGGGVVGALVASAVATSISDCHAGGEIAETSGGGRSVGGLVGEASRCSISDSSSGSAITAAGVEAVGGLVGSITGGSKIAHCRAVRQILATRAKSVGGLVGYMAQSSASRSKAETDIRASNCVDTGGFVGTASKGSELSLSSSESSVVSRCEAESFSAGGFVGSLDGTANACAAGGDVESHGSMGRTGGFVGSSLNAEIVCCAASGSVSSDAIVGGFVGYLNSFYSARVRIEDCCAAGDVSLIGGGEAPAGGFVGKIDRDDGSVVIARCYSFGRLVGSLSGFLGSNVLGTIISCFWRRDGATNAGAGLAHSTPALSTEDFAVSDKFEREGWAFSGEMPRWSYTGSVFPARPYPADAPAVHRRHQGGR